MWYIILINNVGNKIYKVNWESVCLLMEKFLLNIKLIKIIYFIGKIVDIIEKKILIMFKKNYKLIIV